MTAPLRTRADFKRAGRESGIAHAERLARHLLTWTRSELENAARMDGAMAGLLEDMRALGATYLQQGYPECHVKAFCRAFFLAAGERLKDPNYVQGLIAMHSDPLAVMPSPSSSTH